MLATTFITALVAFVATIQAHMEMSWPPSLSSQYNGFTVTADYTNHGNLSPSGSDFPCRSHLSDLRTPAGKSVVDWNAGSEYNFTIIGARNQVPAFHNGGSCQAALSYDAGKTWKVIHSYQGACPTSTGGSFKFNIPSDAKSGAAVFAWLWWNHTGNREMYMNCASVTIAAGTGPAPAIPFADRPDIFKANIGNGCTTTPGTDVFFPNPGPDVTTVGQKKGVTYSGNCGPAAPEGSSGSPPASVQSPTPNADPAPAAAPPPVQNAGAASPSSGGVLTSIVPVVAIAPASAAPTYTPSGVPTSGVPTGSIMTISTNGECGGVKTCLGSTFGDCCSKWGWCGSTADYCSTGSGCMAGFGKCGSVSSRSASIRGRQFQIEES